MGDSRKYTTEEKAAFIHRYTSVKAEEMKNNGEFKDMTVDELKALLIEEVISAMVKKRTN